MKNTSKSLVLLFGVFVAIGVAILVIGVSRMYQRAPAVSSVAKSDASADRPPRYNPWGVLAGIGACLCVLVFIKSVLDWFEKRDRRRAWPCPQCKGAGNTTADDVRKCAACNGAGHITLDR